MSGSLRLFVMLAAAAILCVNPSAAGQNETSASPTPSLSPPNQPSSMSCCGVTAGPETSTSSAPVSAHQPTHGTDPERPTTPSDITTKPVDPTSGGPDPNQPPQTMDLGRIPPGAFIVGGAAAALVGGTGLFSRIQRHRALDQPSRARVMAAVEAEPGIHVEEIRRRLGMNRNAVQHHLGKLEGVGLLFRQESGGFRCYFPAGSTDRRMMAAFPVLKADAARRIARTVVERPGVTATALGATIGLTPAGTHHHLKRLVAAGVVRMEIGAGGARLFPTEITAALVASERAADGRVR